MRELANKDSEVKELFFSAQQPPPTTVTKPAHFCSLLGHFVDKIIGQPHFKVNHLAIAALALPNAAS